MVLGDLLMAIDKSILLEFEPCPCLGVGLRGVSPKERAIHSNQEDQIKFPQGIEPYKSVRY